MNIIFIEQQGKGHKISVGKDTKVEVLNKQGIINKYLRNNRIDATIKEIVRIG